MLNYSPTETLLVGSNTQLFTKSSNIKYSTKMMIEKLLNIMTLFFTPQGLI